MANFNTSDCGLFPDPISEGDQADYSLEVGAREAGHTAEVIWFVNGQEAARVGPLEVITSGETVFATQLVRRDRASGSITFGSWSDLQSAFGAGKHPMTAKVHADDGSTFSHDCGTISVQPSGSASAEATCSDLSPIEVESGRDITVTYAVENLTTFPVDTTIQVLVGGVVESSSQVSLNGNEIKSGLTQTFTTSIDMDGAEVRVRATNTTFTGE